MNDSTANAPAPDVLREELINITMNHGGGNISRTKAGEMVDLMIAKQMMFYAQMADAEVDTTGVEAAGLIAELPGRMNAVISLGARQVEHMLPHDRQKWQYATELLRTTVTRLVELL